MPDELLCECTHPLHDSRPDIPRFGCGTYAWAPPDITVTPPLCLPCMHSCFD